MPVGRKPAHKTAKAAWRRYRPKKIGLLAEHLGISTPAVSKWKQVPADRLEATADWLNVEQWVLRPDLVSPDPWAKLST